MWAWVANAVNTVGNVVKKGVSAVKKAGEIINTFEKVASVNTSEMAKKASSTVSKGSWKVAYNEATDNLRG